MEAQNTLINQSDREEREILKVVKYPIPNHTTHPGTGFQLDTSTTGGSRSETGSTALLRQCVPKHGLGKEHSL